MSGKGDSSTESGPASPHPCGSRDRWYCWRAHVGDQFRALAELSKQGFRAYLPTFIAQGSRDTRPRSLFGPYGFVQFDPGVDKWRAIHSTRGIAHLFSRDAEHPTPLPRGIVEALQARGRPGDGVIDERYQGPEFPDIAAGATLRVVDGPFADLHGICRWSNQKRVGLLLSVMGRQFEVEMPRGLVSKDG